MSNLLKDVVFITLVVLAGTGIYMVGSALGYTIPTWCVLSFLFITQREYREMTNKLFATDDVSNVQTH